MAISEQEGVATLRVMVAVAQADGQLQAEEKEALTSALGGMKVPGIADIEVLFKEKIDLNAQLALIKSDEARAQAYQSAYGIAYADGECTKDEAAVLENIKKTLAIPEEKQGLVKRLFSEASDTILPSNIKTIADPEKRKKEVNEDILKYSILSGVLGAFPIPGIAIAADLAVVAVQFKMIRDIGQYHGHTIDKDAAKSLFYGVAGSTGARIAVNNLARFVPFAGAAFAAGTSFASTWALGKVFDKYFEAGGKDDISKFKDTYKALVADGKKVFGDHKSTVDAKQKEHSAALTKLGEDLKAKKITQDQYNKAVSELK
jgi:uncharacterized protein (DUF697 family)/tellurite resistance protein